MNEQLNIWEDLIPYYKITKPIRLIELFAGIGSQHQALKNLGVKINRSTICEWQVNSIQAYNDIHIRDYSDYSRGKDKEWLVDYLAKKGVSSDYNSPMTKQQLSRKGETWLRNTYNNIIATNNLVNIMSAKGDDLEIVDTDKYEYIMTYSFPCQDLSSAGKGAGMGRNSGTRSGLLWEVERLLKETKELPQILLMENVPDVIGTNNIKHLQEWELFLSQLGYSNHCEILNAKDYGIPQNRNRAFMVSILGDYLYRFPQKQELKLRLKDMLENEVDEKFYLSSDLIGRIKNWKSHQNPLEHIYTSDETIPTRGAGEDHSGMILVSDIKLEQVGQLGGYESSGRIYADDGLSPTIMSNSHGQTSGGYIAPKIQVVGNTQLNQRESGNVYDDGGIAPSLKAADYKRPKQIFLSQDKRLPKIAEKPNYQTDEPQSLDLFNLSVSDISQTITLPNHNSQAIAIKTWNDDTKALKTKEKDMPRDRIYLDNSIGFTITTIDNQQPFIVENFYKSREQREYHANAPTIRADRSGLEVVNGLRIRKLTPKECWRLMGFKDEQFELAQVNQSNSTLYHQAGDSIVVNVLEAIFGQLVERAGS